MVKLFARIPEDSVAGADDVEEHRRPPNDEWNDWRGPGPECKCEKKAPKICPPGYKRANPDDGWCHKFKAPECPQGDWDGDHGDHK